MRKEDWCGWSVKTREQAEPQETGRDPIMGHLAGYATRILNFILGIMGSFGGFSGDCSGEWKGCRKNGSGET